MLILRFFSVFLCYIISVQAIKRDQFPDPMRNPQACGRRRFSYICDPDRLIGTEEQKDKLQYLLLDIRQNSPIKIRCPNGEEKGIQIGIALVNKMEKTFSESTSAAAEDYARQIGRSWGVGDPGCANGMMIFISKQDKIAHIYTGAETRRHLPDHFLGKVISKSSSYFRLADYGSGTLKLLGFIRKRLQERPSWLDNNIGFVIIACVIFAFLGVLAYRAYKIRQERSRGTAVLRRIMNELDQQAGQPANQTDVQRCTMCSICLEEFEPRTTATTTTATTAGRSQNQTNQTSNVPTAPALEEIEQAAKQLQLPMTITPATTAATIQQQSSPLRMTETPNQTTSTAVNSSVRTMICGHVFHDACISAWLREHHQCPLCRAEIGNDGRGSITNTTPQPTDSQAPNREEMISRRASYYAERFSQLFPRIVLGIGGMRVLSDLLSTPARNNRDYLQTGTGTFNRTNIDEELQRIDFPNLQSTLNNFEASMSDRSRMSILNWGQGDISENRGCRTPGGTRDTW
eukprot:GDKJ01028196.1.p1 GENE.GDKJ01028196.1~~GDKJ01028196.1.p1  ORF type:complete len:517 (-),score=43.81 GDKJ01028196.1:36-1586(-)